MELVIDIEANLPHEVAELMCLKCLSRWIGVYPEDTLLKDLECKCGKIGYVVKTGQTLKEVRKMNKPNSLRCNKCVVVNNILRCALCKNKTEDWMKKNLSSRAVTMTGNHDLYQSKLKSEVEE